jgi:hypothetical protein
MSNTSINMTLDELHLLIQTKIDEAISKLQTSVVKSPRTSKNQIQKLYEGLSGHYFELDLNDLDDYDTSIRLLDVMGNVDAFPQTSSLARAITHYTLQTNKIILWASSRDCLIVGNNRSGAKVRPSNELFHIPTSVLKDLGHFSNLSTLKETIGYDEFVASELAIKKQDDLNEKLRKLGGRG